VREVAKLPVIAVCGWSGSGKTTLIEAVIPRLKERGLHVGAVKHDAHRFDIDRPGKDSDRLFRSGANVVLRSSDETAIRWHGESAPDLRETIIELQSRHDAVLVEGHKGTPLPKLWLESEDGSETPADLEGLQGVLGRGPKRVDDACEVIVQHVESAWRHRRMTGGILVGGRSTRMGRPKALLEVHGVTLAERARRALEGQVDELVLLGAGDIPESMAGIQRLPDPPGIHGPMAGILAGLRWNPSAAWIVVSCDLPRLRRDAIDWLLTHRQPGTWAVLPTANGEHLEPLCAVYEPQALHLVERLLGEGRWGPRRLARHAKVVTPLIPPELTEQWRGINTPEELEEFEQG
jgi:glutamate dehydrogenase (NADP+)/cyclic pyranopterin phosphate synthase/molybdopterin-guanine dinucleotide biosynthesis protein A